MGIEMARAFRKAGASVHLVLGGDMHAPWGVSITRVRSAAEMLQACLALWPTMDGVCAVAAVADQSPKKYAPQKLKKCDGTENLLLVRTPDILATLSESKTHQWMLGFAAESENIVENAKEKLIRKGLDALLVNDVSNGKGFGNQTNCLTPVTKGGVCDTLGPSPKHELAEKAVEWLATHLEKT
jgi:phosphopantothenoylcysteine decarboxylase/phosphopantothenate--cysteine ligase